MGFLETWGISYCTLAVKSNLSLDGATREPFWSASPRAFLRAKLRAWVPVWFFMTSLRLSCNVRSKWASECVKSSKRSHYPINAEGQLVTNSHSSFHWAHMKNVSSPHLHILHNKLHLLHKNNTNQSSPTSTTYVHTYRHTYNTHHTHIDALYINMSSAFWKLLLSADSIVFLGILRWGLEAFFTWVFEESPSESQNVDDIVCAWWQF